MAYNVRPFLVFGQPSWFETDYFDIVGELALQPGAPPTQKQSLEALQVLLEERFKLRIRRKSRNLPMYTLAVGKAERN
jgi:uncharacterized protein (TIGR03435 family)